MKQSLKKILIAAALVCGASLAVGSASSTFAETATLTAQQWYDKGCLKTPDGKILGDRVEGSCDMDNRGLYTKLFIKIRVTGENDDKVWGPGVVMHKESILSDKQTIDVEIKNKDGKVLFEKKAVNLNVETGKNVKGESFKNRSFNLHINNTNENRIPDEEFGKSVDLIVKDSTTGKVLATTEYQLHQIDTNCPKFVGVDGHPYACDRLVINYDGEEGKKNWILGICARDLENGYLKNYKNDFKGLIAKLTDKDKKEIELKPFEGNQEYGDGVTSNIYYLDFIIEGDKLADGTYDLDLFKGTTKLGGFAGFELNSKTETAGKFA